MKNTFSEKTTKNEVSDVGELVIDILAEIIVILIYGFIVTWIWNNVAVGLVSGINPITYWGSIGLMVLCRCLFRKIDGSN